MALVAPVFAHHDRAEAEPRAVRGTARAFRGAVAADLQVAERLRRLLRGEPIRELLRAEAEHVRVGPVRGAEQTLRGPGQIDWNTPAFRVGPGPSGKPWVVRVIVTHSPAPGHHGAGAGPHASGQEHSAGPGQPRGGAQRAPGRQGTAGAPPHPEARGAGQRQAWAHRPNRGGPGQEADQLHRHQQKSQGDSHPQGGAKPAGSRRGARP